MKSSTTGPQTHTHLAVVIYWVAVKDKHASRSCFEVECDIFWVSSFPMTFSSGQFVSCLTVIEHTIQEFLFLLIYAKSQDRTSVCFDDMLNSNPDQPIMWADKSTLPTQRRNLHTPSL